MTRTDRAFTRLELLFCVLGAALLLFPAISLVASNKSESERIVCFNNLRQIGRAFQMWANDHGERYPWRVDWSVEGGTFNHPLAPNLFFQFDVISNQLASPKILVCPADATTSKAADNFGIGNRGFLNGTYRNAAVSYFVALHAQPYGPASLLSGDYNIVPSVRSAGCALLPGQPVCLQLTPNDPGVRWTNAIHGTAGHLLFSDGSVQFATSSELRSALNRGNDVNSSGVHYLSK